MTVHDRTRLTVDSLFFLFLLFNPLNLKYHFKFVSYASEILLFLFFVLVIFWTFVANPLSIVHFGHHFPF